MAHSLSEECTPLKHEYDKCFNKWFEGYLQPVLSASTPEERAEHTRMKQKEYEDKCGKVWETYKSCVQVSPVTYFCGGRIGFLNKRRPVDRKQ